MQFYRRSESGRLSVVEARVFVPQRFFLVLIQRILFAMLTDIVSKGGL